MARRVLSHRSTPFVLLALGILIVCAGVFGASQPALAASGQVYSGTLERSYKHPVTGVIEDAGGQQGYATGQGMIEGCLSSSCMLEETSDGKLYLTIRLSLIDYTSKRRFTVQKWGASGWSSTAYGVTKKGKDSDGTTYDYCIQVPSKNAIVRMSMYVKPMGRSVVCYFYAKGLKKGKLSGMTATIVTSQSSSGTGTKEKSAGSKKNTADDKKKNSQSASSTAAQASKGSTAQSESQSNADAESASSASGGTDSSDSAVNSAQGLDLSTQSSSTDGSETSDDNATGTLSSDQLFATVMGAVIAGGAVVIVIAVIVAYYLHKRWGRRDAPDPDDYEGAYRESIRAADEPSAKSSVERAARAAASTTGRVTPFKGAESPHGSQETRADAEPRTGGLGATEPTGEAARSAADAPVPDDGEDA